MFVGCLSAPGSRFPMKFRSAIVPLPLKEDKALTDVQNPKATANYSSQNAARRTETHAVELMQLIHYFAAIFSNPVPVYMYINTDASIRVHANGTIAESFGPLRKNTMSVARCCPLATSPYADSVLDYGIAMPTKLPRMKLRRSYNKPDQHKTSSCWLRSIHHLEQ
jgi:hypothetical protein